MSNKVIVVAGQSGAGKDFLVKAANTDKNVNHVGWGSIFGSIVGENPDEIRHLPGQLSTEIVQAQVVSRILAMTPVIVTSHPVKIIGGRPYVNWGVERILDPASHIFVKAPAETIRDRLVSRNQTGERQSPVPTVTDIENEQNRKLHLVECLSHYVGSKFLVLENIEEHLGDNILAIRQQIEVIVDD